MVSQIALELHMQDRPNDGRSVYYIILYEYKRLYSVTHILYGRYFRLDRFVKKILVLLGLHLQNVKMYLSF